MKVDWDELKRLATAPQKSIACEVKLARAITPMLHAILAEREAAAKLRYDYHELMTYLRSRGHADIATIYERKLTAFDKETKMDTAKEQP